MIDGIMSQEPPGDSAAMAALWGSVFWGRGCLQPCPQSHSLGTHLYKPSPAYMSIPGSHTYQRMIGCELREDGSSTGFLQYAYDGQDFLVFDKDTLSWIAVDNVAHITKRAWEANRHELQYQKNWLEEECIAWLKRFLEYGKDTLQRTGKEKEHLFPHPQNPWFYVYFH